MPAGPGGVKGGVLAGHRNTLCPNYALPPAQGWPTISGMNQPIDPDVEAARRAGFDLDLLDSNLALSPEERALRHDSALELVQELMKAKAAYDKLAPVAQAVR